MEFAKRSRGNFVVSPDREHQSRFSINGHSMWVSDIADMLQKMVEDATKLQLELFAGADPDSEEFAFPPHVVDCWTNDISGYSFATEQENGIDCQALVRHGYLAFGFITEDGRHVFDIKKCLRWARGYSELLGIELGMCHIGGGLPPHGTEQVLSTITQTAGRARTIRLLSNHQVCDIGAYHKTIQMSGGAFRM